MAEAKTWKSKMTLVPMAMVKCFLLGNIIFYDPPQNILGQELTEHLALHPDNLWCYLTFSFGSILILFLHASGAYETSVSAVDCVRIAEENAALNMMTLLQRKRNLF